MRVLIADDEPIARQVLREQLEEFADVEILGEAATGAEALELAQQLKPEAAFLDLQMPELDGLAVARRLTGGLPLVIYVTAYEQYALNAFDAGAIDYLLKPVRKERLAAALAKARAQLGARKSKEPPAPEVRRVVGRSGSDQYLLDPAEIVAFVADGDLVWIHTGGRKYLSPHSLRMLEERLPPPRFRRVHRGALVNTDHIRRISPLSSSRWLLRMSNGMEVAVSKRMATALRADAGW
ncbi:MAG: LytTR family DNA-binding domain-containing protein [Bryobacter sp.]|jgi:DNA-binding LytR/AlgR family response regulator|nr:LytTR family DNA-binding domain-containing protein [Bryobacter sp.]